MSAGRTPTCPYDVAYYEGLIFKTAVQILDQTDEELDDIRQILRIKVWKAIGKYDRARSRQSIKKFVFSCLYNQKIDIVRKKRRNNVSVDALLSDGGRFERDHLSESDEQAYIEVEADRLCLPNTLTFQERSVIVHLYSGRSVMETARALGIRKVDVQELVDRIQEKLADWRPTVRQPVAVTA